MTRAQACNLSIVASAFSSVLGRFSRVGAWNWTRKPAFLIAVGVLAVASGVLLVVRPFASLGALVVLIACGMFVNAFIPSDASRSKPDRALTWCARIAWVTGGILVLAIPEDVNIFGSVADGVR